MATRAESSEQYEGLSFEEEWPELARCLERLLTAKGVDPWVRADVVQETATRIYRRWATIDHSRPLWNLVVTIALRILVDEHRRLSKVEFVADAPANMADDVETRALHAVQLAKTRSALRKLRANQRRVLLAEIGEAEAMEGPRNRINVLRLRARLALRNQLGPWAPAGVSFRIRSLRRSIERQIVEWGRDAQGVTASMATLAVAAALAIAPPLLGDPHPSEGAGASVERSKASPILADHLGKMNEAGTSSVSGLRNKAETTSPPSKPSRTKRDLDDYLQQDAQRLKDDAEGLRDDAEDLGDHVTRDSERVHKDGERTAQDVQELSDQLP